MVKSVAILSGVRLRKELHERGLSQREFARQLGVREATVSNAIRGHPLSAETIYRIALGLELAEVKP